MRHKKILLCLGGFGILALMPVGCTIFNFDKTRLVDEGKSCADIVISDRPTRAVKLAAGELQTYIEKISGAKLAITNAPGADVPAHIYVGRSAETDKFNISDDGLKCGAFRMISGKDYLVLLGHDKDFTLPDYADRQYPDPQALKAWDERTREHWVNPAPNWTGYSPIIDMWELDERGTLNAVYEFLRSLGVRWYMPGDLGEIVPRLKTIALAPVNKTVRPDFPYRNLGDYAPSWIGGSRDGMLYKLRTGIDASLELPGPHGLNCVNGRDEVKKAHPEFYSNHRTPAPNDSVYTACLSSPELIAYTVKYARTVFDIYPDQRYIGIMPNDGFWAGNMCQCELCKGKNTPERGSDGELSDYVWGFVDRVARELYKTHPDRTVVCSAYGAYALPPEKISKFSPNVMVGVERVPYISADERAKALKTRTGWLEKLAPGNLQTWSHYLQSGSRLPAYFPHAIAEDLHSLKGLSQGEFIELTYGGIAGATDFRDMHAPGFNHLNVYVTSRYYWDADQDINALLDEYYEKFYGPAAKEMKALIEYSEANWSKMENNAVPIGKALELLDAARKAAGDTVYGKRIDLVADYCQKPMTEKSTKLAKGRNKDLKFTAESRGKPTVKLDGKLDEAFWKDLPEYSLYDLKTGAVAANALATTFRVAWCDDNAFYFGIRCEEPDIKGLNIGSRNPDDNAIWEGDNIELMIETQGHSYYQIAISPSGAIVDADRKGGLLNILWMSGAQAATYLGDGYWSIELRVPVAGDQEETINPLLGISGRKPTAGYPWYFNMGRQRVRGVDHEYSASAPPKKDGTGGSFHDLWNFGQLIVK